MDKKSIASRCQMCEEYAEVTHHSLYVFGSEGIWLCNDCRLEVTKFIREKRAERFHKNINDKKHNSRN